MAAAAVIAQAAIVFTVQGKFFRNLSSRKAWLGNFGCVGTPSAGEESKALIGFEAVLLLLLLSLSCLGVLVLGGSSVVADNLDVEEGASTQQRGKVGLKRCANVVVVAVSHVASAREGL